MYTGTFVPVLQSHLFFYTETLEITQTHINYFQELNRLKQKYMCSNNTVSLKKTSTWWIQRYTHTCMYFHTFTQRHAYTNTQTPILLHTDIHTFIPSLHLSSQDLVFLITMTWLITCLVLGRDLFWKISGT